MKITINIPFAKYIFLIKKFFKKIEVRKFCKANKFKLSEIEISNISESLTIFPEFDVGKIVTGYMADVEYRKTANTVFYHHMYGYSS